MIEAGRLWLNEYMLSLFDRRCLVERLLLAKPSGVVANFGKHRDCVCTRQCPCMQGLNIFGHWHMNTSDRCMMMAAGRETATLLPASTFPVGGHVADLMWGISSSVLQHPCCGCPPPHCRHMFALHGIIFSTAQLPIQRVQTPQGHIMPAASA